MSAKRASPSDGRAESSGQPPPKKLLTQFEPVRLGPCSSQEEMDVKILRFQNKKLGERLEVRQMAEAELRQRIEQLEKRQTQDDAILYVVNRYWNQLNDDMRILLERFDAETSDESENKNENEATTSFLAQLTTWDKSELEDKLAHRVQVSQRAVGKIVQAFDRIVQRNEKITLSLKGEDGDQGEPPPNLEESVRQTNIELQAENKRLHTLITQLHECHHVSSLKVHELQDRVSALETENAEMKNRIDDLSYDLERSRYSEEKLDRHLFESLEKLNTLMPTEDGAKTPAVVGLSQRKVDDLQLELEEQRELSANRLAELEKLHHDHKMALQEVERLKMELKTLPEAVIVETTEYKCLQSQFSVLYNESLQLKTQLDESRALLQSSKNTHMRQIEQMEAEELAAQKRLRREMIQLEDTLARVRKEYEMLRIEFEQNLAANEQTGPINREMRHLITSLQNHNQQLKGEISRYKRKLKEAHSDLHKARKLTVGMGSHHASEPNVKEEPSSNNTTPSSTPSTSSRDLTNDKGVHLKEESTIKREDENGEDREREKGKSDGEIIRDLKVQLKKAQEAQKELKLLLDMYKGVAKEQRDKVQLMAGERKTRLECEELKQQLRKLQDGERKERKKLADEDALRRIRQLDEQVFQLHRSVAAQKNEEEALLNEMEVTGQAFEDMQEQNIRLIQQLREKDDANFKLMSERIKSNQIVKLMREEKDMLADQVHTLHTQVESQNQVVRRLEEKERILQNSLTTIEKELSLRQQALEMHKRKAIESAQSAADLKMHLEKYLGQLKEVQASVADKTSSLQQDGFKTKRLQEEIGGLKKKLERSKKFELANTADEVLMEEIKEYKDQLTCPSCKVKKKDAVLTKCFHVFCFDCVKTRYETRQRKCPKCNAGFGANDFHRLFLA